MPTFRWIPRRVLTEDPPAFHDAGGQRRVLTRVHDVRPAAEHRHRLPAGVKGTLMSGAIHAQRHSAHHRPPRSCEIASQLTGDDQPGRCRSSGADNGDTAGGNGAWAPGPEDDRRVGDLPQTFGVIRRARRDQLQPATGRDLELVLSPSSRVGNPLGNLTLLELKPMGEGLKVQYLVSAEPARPGVRPGSE